MKIVQITTDNRNQYGHYTMPAPYFGTAPTSLFDGFADIPGIEVHVISCASRVMNRPEKLADNIWFHQPLVPKIGWGRTLFLGCALAVRGLVKKLQPDIVHGQGTERDCAMGAVLSGVPNLLTIHGNMKVHASRPENRTNTYYKMAAMLEGFCLSRTDGVVAISRYTEDLIRSRTARTWLLPNGVDRRFFEIEPIHNPIPRILFVGSLDERKNPLGLLKACEPMLRAGECTLTLAGQSNPDHPYVREMMALAQSLPGVQFTGFIGRAELEVEFRQSSLLVLPTFEDNCPMVVLEAMAAGLPVAASRVGGIPDLIEHEVDGLMFDPHDMNAIRDAVALLVKNPHLRENIGQRARQKAMESFHPSKIAESHVEIYRKLLNQSTGK
jgi:glycosyltransferase involved in cell wall biosynthesis